jgi:hypothetical protein
VFIYKLVNLKIKESDIESYLSEFGEVMRDIEKRKHNIVK